MPALTRTIAPATRSGAVAMTVVSMSSVQLSDAFSVPLIGSLGAAGAAWLRVTLGALMLCAVVRPRVRSLTAAQWGAILPLGVFTATLSASFMAALQQLPLGTTASLAFLGPLVVAVTGRDRRAGRWAVLALVGVLLLTEPWRGASVSLTGVALGLAAASSWAGCIVTTSRTGDRVQGLDGIALAMPVAALCLAPWGSVPALAGLDLATTTRGVSLAVLMPVLPCVLELSALRRLPQGSFATLMALEPVLATVTGVVVLGQLPGPLAAVGVLLVVAAGLGATWTAPPRAGAPGAALVERLLDLDCSATGAAVP